MNNIKKMIISKAHLTLFFKIYILNAFLFQLTFLSTSISLIDNYLKAFDMQNGNLLICTDKAIYLYSKSDGEYSQQISFETNVSQENFNFVTISQFEVGRNCIVVLYINIIYIFVEDGQYFTGKNFDFNSSGKYYTLITYKLQINSDNSNYYYFLVGYIRGEGNYQFIIDYFYLNNLTGEIILVEEKSLLILNHENVSISYGFSCEIMESTTYGTVLTCFYNVEDDLIISSYNITNFDVIPELILETEEHLNPIFISSVTSKDKTKSLICYLKNGNFTRCEKYNINNNSLNLIYEENISKCRNQSPSTTVLYNSITNKDYIFGCYGYNYDYNLIKFNSDFEIESIINNNQYIISDCECSTFSIVNFSNYNNYSIITSCNNNKGIILNDFPEGIKYDKTQNLLSVTDKIEKSIETTNIVEETSYIDNIIDDINASNYSNQIEVNSTQLIIDSTLILNEISTMMNDISQYFNISQYNETIYKTNNIINKLCPKEYLYQSIETNECLNTCNVDDLINRKCKINKVTNLNINNYTENIRNIIRDENLTSETNIVFEGNNAIYQIVSSTKMTDNENSNLSIIDLGECERILLEKYNLDYLLILKIDTKLNENSAIILNYEIYNPITNDKLNLSLCNNVKINTYSIYYPSEESISKIKKLSESGYDLYNINDDFYQDLCSPFTTENGTDILLSDRKSDFYENISLCEDKCTYKGFDLTKKRIQCECPIKEELKVEEVTKEKIIDNLFRESSFSNIKLLKCFKLVFSKRGQKNNKGSIIFLCIIFSVLILAIIYAINQEKYIIRNISKVNNEKYLKNKNNKINNIHPQSSKNLVFPPKKQKRKINKESKYVIFDYLKNHQNITHSSTNIKQLSQSNSNSNKNIIFISNQENNNVKIEEKKETMKYELYNFIDEELNSLSYEIALKCDKRIYFHYYISLLKQKHLILFTFCNHKDYNIFVLKFSLFLSSFALYFAVNALFFNDDTMHTIYKQNGNTEIMSQFANILYSTIISCFINLIIKKLGLSYNEMVRIKKIPDASEGIKQSLLLMKKLKRKFLVFYLIIFILISFFWYFISAFCAVYINTQIILIKNTLSSFALSLLYPLGINLVPGLLRIPSLKNYSGCSKYAYFISKVIALI